jgi:hypothetical protein
MIEGRTKISQIPHLPAEAQFLGAILQHPLQATISHPDEADVAPLSDDAGRCRQQAFRVFYPIQSAHRADQHLLRGKTEFLLFGLAFSFVSNPVDLRIDPVVDGIYSPGGYTDHANVEVPQIIGHGVEPVRPPGQQPLQKPPSELHLLHVRGEKAMDAVHDERSAGQSARHHGVKECPPVVGVNDVDLALSQYPAQPAEEMISWLVMKLVDLHTGISKPVLQVPGLLQTANRVAKGLIIESVDHVDHAILQSPHLEGIDDVENVNSPLTDLSSPAVHRSSMLLARIPCTDS